MELTARERLAISKLSDIAGNLNQLGPRGVLMATGFDKSDNLTKREMISKYLNTKYAEEVALAQKGLKRVGKPSPYYLGEGEIASIEEIKAGLEKLYKAMTANGTKRNWDDIIAYFDSEEDVLTFDRYFNKTLAMTAMGFQADQHRKDVRQFLARHVLKSTNEGAKPMTIGSQFLARLNEAKKPAPKAEETAKVDSATERFKRSLRDIGSDNLSDAAADILNLLGVPGRFLNTKEVRDSVIAAAQELKTKPARVAVFLALHSALAKESLAEAKGAEAELDGNQFQKMVEEIISELGYSLSDPVAVKSIKRRVQSLISNQSVKQALIAFAKRFQIRVGDGEVGSKKPGMKKLGEAANDALEVPAAREKAVAGITSAPEKTARELLGHFGVDLAVLPPKLRQPIVDKMSEVAVKPRVVNAMRTLIKVLGS